jgi:hypothetical protein
MLYAQIYDETRKSKRKRKVQGEIKGETVSLISRRPSDPNGPDGPPRTRVLIGGAPIRCVAGGPPSRYAIKEGGGQRHTGRGSPLPPPHRHREPYPIKEAQQRREVPPAAAVNTTTSSPCPRSRPQARLPQASAPPRP